MPSRESPLDKVTVPAARRKLTGRRAESVVRLADAAVELLRDTGYHEITFGKIAERAGVGRATAYIYFSSKDHLIAELYWRRLLNNVAPAYDFQRDGAADRVVVVLRSVALMLVDQPELSKACYQALSSSDPDVLELRVRVAQELRSRIADALGTEGVTADIELIELIYFGAIMNAGAGRISDKAIADTVELGARRLLR